MVPVAKRAKTGPAAAASGADAGAAQGDPGQIAATTSAPQLITELLTTSLALAHGKDYVSHWAAQTKAHVDQALVRFLRERSSKVSFPVQEDVLLFPAWEIQAAASGAKLTSFREVMHHENLTASFAQSAMYEAAGTIFMCDIIGERELTT